VTNRLSPARGRPAPRAAAVALLLAAAGVAACRGDQPTQARAAQAGAIPDSAEQVMFGMRTYVVNNGVVRGELFSDTAYTYDAGNRLELRGVRLNSYGTMGDSTATVTSRSGTYDVRLGRVEGRGDVKVVATDGRQLTSPRLVYDKITNQISSDTAFDFVAPGRKLSGVGFRSDPGLRNVQVLSGARGGSTLGRTRR
jgi:LPS export ABC transporter protein LptC